MTYFDDDFEDLEGLKTGLIRTAIRTGGEQASIARKGLEVVNMLLEKNRAYGSSVFNPVRVFAKNMTPIEMIHVRMDDKLSRIVRADPQAFDGEDAVLDLAGYCILELVARDQQAAGAAETATAFIRSDAQHGNPQCGRCLGPIFQNTFGDWVHKNPINTGHPAEMHRP